MALLFIPAICLFLFFHQKCDGIPGQLVTQAREYRTAIAEYGGFSVEKVIAILGAATENEQETQILNQAKYIFDYGSYLDGVQRQAEKLGQTGIFGNDPNTYTYRNIIKTADDFEGVTADGVSLGNDRAVSFWLSFSWMDWAFLAVIAILVMSFLEDRKKSLLAIIRTSPGGRGRLQLERLLVLVVYSAGMTLLIYYLPLVLSLLLDGGWEGLSRPVQSLAEFQKCTASMSISQFFVRFFFVKAACGVLLGVLIWFLLSFLSRPQMGWLVTAAGLATEYLLYTLIPVQSVFSPLREINVFSCVFTLELYTRYTNINFFGFPVGRRTLLLVLLVIVTAGLAGALIGLLPRRFPLGNRDILGKWLDRWNRAGDAARKRFGLYGFELYKFVFLCAGGLFLISGLILTRNLTCGTSSYLAAENNLYLQYVTEVQGPVTEDTYDYITRAREALERSNADTADYEIALDQLEANISDLEDGAWLVNETYFMCCYGIESAGSQRLNALLAYMFLAACLSALFACEQSGDVRKILRSTSGGRQRLFRTKYAVALTVTVLVWLRVFCGEWRLSAGVVGETLLSAPCSSLSLVQHYPMTVSGLLTLVYLFKLVCLLIPMHLCVFAGIHCRRFETAFLISGAALILPAAAYYYGADGLAALTPASLLADNCFLLYGAGSLPLFIAWMVLSVAALLAAKRSWCRTGK